jgi:hypothetical protein
MKFLVTFLLALLLASSVRAQCSATPNGDGSYSCAPLYLMDGGSFAYTTFFISVIYPMGISCDALGNLYTLQPSLVHTLMGCVVNLPTGQISCGPTNQTAQQTLSITIN